MLRPFHPWELGTASCQPSPRSVTPKRELHVEAELHPTAVITVGDRSIDVEAAKATETRGLLRRALPERHNDQQTDRVA